MRGSEPGASPETSFLEQAVVVALGSNLARDGESPATLVAEAADRLAEAGMKPLRLSRWWRSAAWPDPGEPDYINGVAIVDTALPPAAALAALHDLEARFGRVRGRTNASRTLDLDLIAYGRRVSPGPGPVLPHPRAHERLFVMGPLAEIAPGWRHPVIGETAEALAARATVGRDAAPL